VRALFLILLVANLLFLAWAQWIDGPRDQGAHDSLSHLPRLQLMGEKGGAKPSAANSSLSGPWSSDPTPDPSVSPTLASASTLQIPVAPKPTPLASAAAEKIALQIPVTPPAPRCTSVGPFSDIAHAAKAAGLLTQRGYKLQQRAEEGETIEGYWVFVGGLTSDQDVNEVVARLEKNGIADAHVMKNFSTNRRISIGMFSTQERAEKRANAVKALGLSPEVGERKFPGTVYWVDVALASAEQKPPAEYLFADIGHARVEMQPCPAGLVPGKGGQPSNDGGDKVLPRTTVASAPLVIQH
jgi:cell division septation protein DedD